MAQEEQPVAHCSGFGLSLGGRDHCEEDGQQHKPGARMMRSSSWRHPFVSASQPSGQGRSPALKQLGSYSTPRPARKVSTGCIGHPRHHAVRDPRLRGDYQPPVDRSTLAEENIKKLQNAEGIAGKRFLTCSLGRNSLSSRADGTTTQPGGRAALTASMPAPFYWRLDQGPPRVTLGPPAVSLPVRPPSQIKWS
jgi:hypothetical protein